MHLMHSILIMMCLIWFYKTLGSTFGSSWKAIPLKPPFLLAFLERLGLRIPPSPLGKGTCESMCLFWAEICLEDSNAEGGVRSATEADMPVTRLRRRPAWKAAEPPVGIPPSPWFLRMGNALFIGISHIFCSLISAPKYSHSAPTFTMLIFSEASIIMFFFEIINVPQRLWLLCDWSDAICDDFCWKNEHRVLYILSWNVKLGFFRFTEAFFAVYRILKTFFFVEESRFFIIYFHLFIITERNPAYERATSFIKYFSCGFLCDRKSVV